MLASTPAMAGPHRPVVPAWEGGGEYNVARGLRRCFGLRTAVVTAFAETKSAASSRTHLPGRRRHLVRPVGALRRHRPQRAQRPQLHRARLRAARRGGDPRIAATPRPAAPSPATWTGTTYSAEAAFAGFTPAVNSPPSPDSTPEVIEEAMATARQPRDHRLLRPQLPAEPLESIGGKARAQEVNRRLAGTGGRDDRQRGGFHRLPWLRGAGNSRRCRRSWTWPIQQPSSRSRVGGSQPRGHRDDLRRAKTASRNDWGAVACYAGGLVQATPRHGRRDPQSRRRRRYLRLGADLRALGTGRPGVRPSSVAPRTEPWP